MDIGKRHRSATWLTIVGVLAFSMFSPQLTMADRPGVGGVEGSTDPGPGPLTPQQQASRDVRFAQVEALLVQDAGGGITPQGVCEGGEDPPCQQPPPSSYSLATHARHQHRWFYCGAAVAQEISNYTWGYTSTSVCGGDGCAAGINKYNQHTISTNWTKTDLHGQTYVGDLVAGLNGASIKPAGFVYAYQTNMPWSQFHGEIRVDTYSWRMPLAARVDPRHVGSPYFLASWAGVTPADYGHYIALRGYSGSAQSTAYAYYNDSSGGKDEHDTSITVLGSTGAFSDKSFTVYQTMVNNTTSGSYYLIW